MARSRAESRGIVRKFIPGRTENGKSCIRTGLISTDRGCDVVIFRKARQFSSRQFYNAWKKKEKNPEPPELLSLLRVEQLSSKKILAFFIRYSILT
jgi:hypothetical protein